jgi:arylformamidase
MAGVRPTRIAPQIVQVPVVGSSVFLLLDERVTIVDSGPPGSAPRILHALRRLGRDADEVEQILITHYHPDHLGGLAGLLRHVPARVGVHAAEAPAVCGDEPMPAPLRYARLAARLAPAMRWVRRCPVDTVLRDGDELPVLGGLRVVHTPGHTPGHIALYLPERGVLMAGDALQRRAAGLIPAARLVTADWFESLRSIEKLATLDFDILALSHFPPLCGRACENVRRLAADLPPRPPSLEGRGGLLRDTSRPLPSREGGRGGRSGERGREVRFIDISLALSPTTPVYPGDPPLTIERLSEARGGESFAVSRLTLGSHTGTHVDSPAHYLPGSTTVDALPLDALIGSAVVLDISGRTGEIGPEELRALPDGAERVLFRTNSPPIGGRALSTDAAALLAARGVRLAGIDTLSIGPAASPGEVHRRLLAAGVVILEGLDLANAPAGGYTLLCLPLKLAGGDGAPARAILVQGGAS